MDATPQQPARLPVPALVFSVLANLIPIAGVIWFGWDAIQLLFLFWTESLIVGAVTFQRIRMAEGQGPRLRMTGVDSEEGFFALHYGIFWLVHGILLIVFTAVFPELGGVSALWNGVFGSVDFWVAVAAMAISYAMGFWYGWVRPQAWRFATPGRELLRPYGRLIAMHLVMTMGLGIMISTGGDSTAVILILCLVKALFDLIFEAVVSRNPVRPAAS